MYSWVDQKPYIEYHAGRKVRKMSPSTWHTLVEFAMATIIRRCAADRGKVGPEWHFDMSVQLGEKTILVPDVAFVRRERLFGLSKDYLQVPAFAPDIAVEVRSPNDRPGEREWKIAAYLRAGSSLVLDVDPFKRRIRAFSPGNDERAFTEADRFSHDAVPWLTFDVSEAFVDLTI